jgi:hypothetical protein
MGCSSSCHVLMKFSTELQRVLNDVLDINDDTLVYILFVIIENPNKITSNKCMVATDGCLKLYRYLRKMLKNYLRKMHINRNYYNIS